MRAKRQLCDGSNEPPQCQGSLSRVVARRRPKRQRQTVRCRFPDQGTRGRYPALGRQWECEIALGEVYCVVERNGYTAPKIGWASAEAPLRGKATQIPAWPLSRSGRRGSSRPELAKPERLSRGRARQRSSNLCASPQSDPVLRTPPGRCKLKRSYTTQRD